MKLQKQKIEPLLSTALQPAIIPLIQTDISASTLHQCCKTLPLLNFIECYCNNDLSYLTITGNPIAEELLTAWNEILFEWAGLIKTENSDMLFNLQKDIVLLQYHIFFVENAVQVLWYKYDVEITNELAWLGYNIADDFGSETYTQQLNTMVSLAKTIVFDLEELQHQYDSLQKTTTGKKQTEEEFGITVSILSKYQGYRIITNETTVKEFAAIFNSFIKENKRSND